MLTQRQIDEIINASRQADEGPTQLVLRVESAVLEISARMCDRSVSSFGAAHALRKEGREVDLRRHSLDSSAGPGAFTPPAK